MTNRNPKIIEEFRANGGAVGGVFEGRPLLLVHSTGAKSGEARVTPLMYQRVGGSYAVFASKAGAPSNPAWFYNLTAHPDTSIEVGDETIPVTARVASGDERTSIWEKQKTDYPFFAEYEATAGRRIPVVILDPAF